MDIEEQDTARVTKDPWWVLHEPQVAGEPADYHDAYGAVVDEEGVPYEPDQDGVLAPVDEVDEPAWDEVALAALVVSVLLTVALLGLVVSRWGPATPTDAARPTSRLELPVAVARDSEYVRSRVLRNGDIRVDHWVASTRPIPRIALRPPAASGADRVTAREVQVETRAGDRAGPEVVDASPVTYGLDGAEEVHVSYVLAGAVDRSEGSTRALARVTSLDLSYPGGRVPRTVLVQGGRLLSAACTSDAAAQPRPCGQAEGRSWRVRLEPPERDDLVLAQLDLI